MQIDAPTTTVYQNGAPAYNYSNGVKSVDASTLPGNQSNPNVLLNKPATNAVMPKANPTTLYSGNVENKYIPDQNSRLDKLSQVGPYNDQTGNSYYANGDQMDTSSDDSDLMSDPSYKLLSDLRNKNDATTDSYISSIQDSYKNSLIPQQEAQNAAQSAAVGNTLLRYGASRTGSGIAAGASVANAGLQAISDLTAKENQAIAQARQAQQDGDFKTAEDQITVAENLRKDKQAAAKELATEQQAQTDAQAKTDATNQKDVNAVVAEAAKNGAPSDVIAAISAATDAGTATQAAGEYLQSGEYFDYKRAAQASGATPVDAATYYARKIYGASGAPGAADPFTAGTVPFQSTIETAASFAGTADKTQQAAQQQLGQLAQSGDYAGLLSRMETLARNGMSSADKTDTFTAQNQIKSLTDMGDALKAYQAAGGDMNFLIGNEDTIARRIGTLATDPKFASIATQLKAAFQQYRNNMTGAAFGASENADYKQVFPSADKSFELNASVIDGLKNYYQENVNNAYETQLGDGYNNLKDYVDNGLTPTGSYLLKTEADAKNKLIDLGKQNPNIQNSASAFLKDNPSASAYDVLQFLGVPVATSNEVSMASGSGNRPQRNNNPLNIKSSGTTSAYQGVTGTDPTPAADGGQFLTFASPTDGLNAAKKLITSGAYQNLSVDAALKRWSGNGYGADIVPDLQGKKMSDLTPSQLDELIQKMAAREGFYA